jgi:hypothetical protein
MDLGRAMVGRRFMSVFEEGILGKVLSHRRLIDCFLRTND